MSQASSNINVFVRVRPPVDRRFPCVVEVPNSKELVVSDKTHAKKTFRFSEVFGPTSTQAQVYSSVVDSLVADVLSGYQCTVFVYGQTGSGKTFTMQGRMPKVVSENFSLDLQAGMIPRTVNSLFDELKRRQSTYSINVSFLELYNEDVYDLLSPEQNPPKLKIFEAKKRGVVISGLQEVPVENKLEVFQVLQRGFEKRQTAATLMNAKSSRSHTIFTISVTTFSTDASGKKTFCSCKMNLVDLAGSENVERSGAVEKRAREAGSINQSLLTLGRVISALVEGSPHIPYRESKLTRLLQQSLGGCTKTSIIATVSPSSCDLEETLSTLDYAHRAKNVKNRPESDVFASKTARLSELGAEIRMLQLDLEATRTGSGFLLDQDSYKDIISSAETFEVELNEKMEHIKALLDQMAKWEAACDELVKRAEQVQEKVEEVQAKQIEQNSVLSHTVQEVQKQKRENDISSFKLMLKSKLNSNFFQYLQHILHETANSRIIQQQLFEKLDREKAAGAQNLASIHDAVLEYTTKTSMIKEKVDETAEQSRLSLVHFEGEVMKDALNFEALIESIFDQCNHVAESSETIGTINQKFIEIKRKMLEAPGGTAGKLTDEMSKFLKNVAYFKQMVSPGMQNGVASFSAWTEELKKIDSFFKACRAEQLTMVEQHFQDLKEGMQKPFLKLGALVAESHKRSQESSTIFKEKKELYQKNVRQKLAEARAALASLNSLQEEWDSFVMDMSQSRQDRMSVLKSEVQSLMDEFRLESQNIQLKNDAFLGDYKQCSETMMSTINQILPKIETEIDVITANLDQMKQNYNMFVEFRTEAESSSQLLVSQKSTFPEELKNIRSSLNEVLSPFWRIGDEVDCFKNNIFLNLPGHLSRALESIQELREKFGTETLILLNEAFQSLNDLSMNMAVPTGDTPQRTGPSRAIGTSSILAAPERARYMSLPVLATPEGARYSSPALAAQGGADSADFISPILTGNQGTYLSVANISYELAPSDDDLEDEGLPDLDRTFRFSKSSDDSIEFKSMD